MVSAYDWGMNWPDHPFIADRHGACGRSRADLRRALSSGAVRRLLRSVYVAADVPDSQGLRARAASLIVPEHAVVSDRSAAWLHGVDAFDPAALDVPPALEMVMVGKTNGSSRAGVIGGVRDLAPTDVTCVDGVRVTTPLRTAADLGCLRGRSAAYAAMCLLARAGGFGVPELSGLLPRFAGRRGVIQLRELVPLVEPRSESPGECWTLLVILDAGLARPTPQHEFWLEGWGLVRLDFAYPHLKVCVEYDGEEFHDEESRAHDEARRWHLRQQGWVVIVVRKEDLKGAALDGWLGELRSELDRAHNRRRYSRSRAPRAARPF